MATTTTTKGTFSINYQKRKNAHLFTKLHQKGEIFPWVMRRTINGYEGEFVDDLNGYFIRYGCATFNIQFINELHGLIGRNKVLFGNKDIKSIKLNSDVEITTEQIKQIYEYIQEKL